MNRTYNLLPTLCLALATAMTAMPATAGVATASCSVAVDYMINGNISEAYRKDFIVQEGVGYVDDFSTRIRFKVFSASVSRANGDATVSISYSSDVSAFNAIDFTTALKVGGGKVETTAGNHTFSTSTASGFFRHATNYTLSCKQV